MLCSTTRHDTLCCKRKVDAGVLSYTTCECGSLDEVLLDGTPLQAERLCWHNEHEATLAADVAQLVEDTEGLKI